MGLRVAMGPNCCSNSIDRNCIFFLFVIESVAFKFWDSTYYLSLLLYGFRKNYGMPTLILVLLNYFIAAW